MSVQARFYVAEVTRYAYNSDQSKVTLRAVARGEENKSWAAATPSGEITLTIGNANAAKWFADRLGRDVAMTFEDRTELCADCKGDALKGIGQYQAPLQASPGVIVCVDCYKKRQS